MGVACRDSFVFGRSFVYADLQTEVDLATVVKKNIMREEQRAGIRALGCRSGADVFNCDADSMIARPDVLGVVRKRACVMIVERFAASHLDVAGGQAGPSGRQGRLRGREVSKCSKVSLI